MGGFDTMITEKTKNVLIESAWFDPATVRSMAKRHGMHTDASHRFERGADYGITPLACDRVAELILDSAGGELHGERIDTVARELKREPIPLRHSEIKRNLGIDIGESEIERILRRLGFELRRTADPSTALRSARDDSSKEASAGDFIVQVPTWRLDVEREIDLLEELARIYGYNNFPNTLPAILWRRGRTAGRAEERQSARHHAGARLRRGDLDYVHLGGRSQNFPVERQPPAFDKLRAGFKQRKLEWGTRRRAAPALSRSQSPIR